VYPGRIDADLIRATVPGIAHSICFLCGPVAMIEQMKAVLPTLGVPAAQTRHEVFEAAVAASAAKDDARAAEEPRPSSRMGYQMRCTRSAKTVSIAAGQTLLEAAEAGGVAIESLCRAGICGTCRTRVTDGEVECTSDALSAEERTNGFVLACVASPRSHCTVDV
jgi:ferredoxin